MSTIASQGNERWRQRILIVIGLFFSGMVLRKELVGKISFQALLKRLDEYPNENIIIITVQVLNTYSEAKLNGDPIGVRNHCLKFNIEKAIAQFRRE